MPAADSDKLIPLATGQPIWDRFFTVFPLVIVGSKEPDGRYDLAPKHLAMPLGWENYFGFVCSPRHGTYHNIRRNAAFTVSYPRPRRCCSRAWRRLLGARINPSRASWCCRPFPRTQVDGVLVKDAISFWSARCTAYLTALDRTA